MRKLGKKKLLNMDPAEFRRLVRSGICVDTVEVCKNFAQANLVILAKKYADDFMQFCQENSQPCPLIDISDVGNPHPSRFSQTADLRTDLPKYRIFKDGKIIDEPTNILNYWQEDFVCFLLGCSRGIMWAFKSANIKWRRYGAYKTNIQCNPSRIFSGSMVVTPRAFFSTDDAVKAITISTRHPLAHGAPVYMGNPELIGIDSIGKPDSFNPYRPFTDSPKEGEIVLYWGCGVTPQSVALESKISLMITHCPTYMFVMDELSEELTLF